MTKYILFLLLFFFVGITTAYIISTVISHSQRLSLTGITPLPNPTLDTKQPNEERDLVVLFGGDMMFDRSIRQQIEKKGIDSIFAELINVFSEADVVVANLEGPVTNNTSVSVNSEPGSTKNFIFTFAPEITKLLQENNMIVNIGNNHITNFGVDGVIQTKQYLTEQQVDFFGNTGQETEPSERVLFKKIRGHTLVFVNYNQFTTNGLENALADIDFAKNTIKPTSKHNTDTDTNTNTDTDTNTNTDTDTDTNTIIVYTHWGNEYVPIANNAIQNQAHQFIDAGADVIIGSHPHVVQQKEIYENKTIYYSLGNFVFDQYFSSETMNGLLVSMTINSDGILAFEEIPITLLTNGKTVLKSSLKDQ